MRSQYEYFDIVDKIRENVRKKKRRKTRKLFGAEKKNKKMAPPAPAVVQDQLLSGVPDLRQTPLRLRGKDGHLWPLVYFLDYTLQLEGNKVRFVGRLRPDGKRTIEGLIGRDQIERIKHENI